MFIVTYRRYSLQPLKCTTGLAGGGVDHGGAKDSGIEMRLLSKLGAATARIIEFSCSRVRLAVGEEDPSV